MMEADDGNRTKMLAVTFNRPEAEVDGELTESDDDKPEPAAAAVANVPAGTSPKCKSVSDLVAANAKKRGFVASTGKVLGSSIAGLAVDEKVAAAIAGIRRLSGLQVRRSPRG